MEPETIGQQLCQAREARSLTLEQVAQSTRMRLRYLQAMEAGDFAALPSIAQARGFLRTYATFLGLDAKVLLNGLNGALDAPPAAPLPASPQPLAVLSSDGTAGNSAQAAEIFAEVGQCLQHQRELLGLSLDDVVRHTHLRRHYLVALETGDILGLPSPVQGRGMLKNYSTFLGLDPDTLLLRFADGLQARLAARQQIQRTETKQAPGPRRKWKWPLFLRRLFSSDILIGGTLAIFLVGFVFWGAIRIFSIRADEKPSPTAPSIADVLLATTTPTATSTPEPATQNAPQPAPGQVVEAPTETPEVGVTETEEITADGTPSSSGATGVKVYITVHQRAWMRVNVDGKSEFEGRVLPGSAYSFSGDERVEVLTGNGAALQIFFNQQDLGLLGLFGQVVNQVYTQDGAFSPTPTTTSTPSATPRSSPTPRSAVTPGPGTQAVPVLP